MNGTDAVRGDAGREFGRRIGLLWWRLALTNAAAFLAAGGWRLHFYGFTWGDWGFGFIVRRRTAHHTGDDR